MLGVEMSEMEWVPWVFFEPKKDGSFRYCVDYRKLNAVTKSDSYPTPSMGESFDSFGHQMIFSTLNADHSYFQVEIEGTDRDKTGFTSHHGFLQLSWKPLGLCKAPWTSQLNRYISWSPVKRKIRIDVLNDIIIFSQTTDEHNEKVRSVL